MIDPELIRFEDYAIRIVKAESHWVDFLVVRIVMEDEEEWGFRRPHDHPGDFVTSFDAAEKFLAGSIKWDGCSNWTFDNSGIALHFCGRKDATSVGRLLDKLYDLAREKMGATFDDGLAA